MSAAAGATASRTGTSTWLIDTSHSSIHFSIRHMMVSNVRGEFTQFAGTAVLDHEDVSRSSIQVTIDANSIDTREPQRDQHLRGPDFLEIERYPTIEFRSTRVEPTGEGQFRLTGDLTIHGVTRPIVLQVEADGVELKDPWGNIKQGASATTKLNRKDFGLQWNVALETGGILVGDELKVVIDLELTKQR
jgi:polyisoprenoid-binding protein YceI